MSGNNISNMSDLMAVKGGTGEVLGKLLYFSLGNVQVERETLAEICRSLDITYSGVRRKNTSSNAFRSATGDLYERIVEGERVYYERIVEGERVYKVYCRDNHGDSGIISRELVKETLGADNNRYSKLANIQYDKSTDRFDFGNTEYDPHVDPYTMCERAGELFEVYKRCAGRKQIEGIAEDYLNAMEAIKISIHSRLYFVLRGHIALLNIFEDFIEALNTHNRNKAALTVNSMYVLDDQKQRDKMAAEFYNHIRT